MNEDPPGEPPARPEPVSAGSPIEPSPAAPPPSAPAERPTPARPGETRPRAGRPPKPDLVELREPVYREVSGYRLRLDPPDLARLRELPGSKGKTDRELGEEFLDGQAARLTAALAGDVDAPAEIRIVVDPYSRQAFLALENKIRGILSF